MLVAKSFSPVSVEMADAVIHDDAGRSGAEQLG